ncbi:ParB/Srx family N-terminal domain-containing protein [Phyllobacterium sp. LjRoot231]|uniref:ParB/RepB/Spo0J family partition protein n=1 Tax=Phyllobacterium sp. LjRoot231 TaxID=3342289 RepID=UPI003ED0C310
MTLQTDSVTIALNDLHFGHEATPPINARLSDRDSEIKEFAGSIEGHGLIHPLLVKKIDGEYFVADGNRRLAALNHLASLGSIDAHMQVKCELDESGSDAAELSLAANIMRKDLHPADMYVAFKELSQRDLDEVQIANRFGVEPVRVRKFLALGNIAPVILDAWRNDELGRDAIPIIRAFTMGKTQEDQVRVFDDLKQSDSLNSYQVGKAFGAGDQATQKNLRICGIEAYQAAGGAIVVDLFGESHAVADPQLAQQLADQSLIDKQEALIANGWSWASFTDAMGYNWRYMDKITPKKGVFTTEQKATAGCAIEVQFNGDVVIHEGIVMPAKSKATSVTSASSDEPAQPAMISAALMERLSVQATEAMRDAIVLDPRIGLIALLAAHMTNDYSTKPVKASHEGWAKSRERGEISFTSAFELLCNKSDEGLFEVAAEIAAAALDIVSQNPHSMPFKDGNGVLAAELDAGNTYVALRGRMDYEDYFKSVPKAFVMKAIVEALNEDEARKVASLKKPDLAAFALANVPPTGWLPVELRTVHYSGPGAE